MKNRVKFISLLLVVVIVIVLAGCGAKIETTMNVDDNFKGERIITATLTDSEVKEYVTGGYEAINEVIDKNLNKNISYSVDTGDGTHIYEFKITFDSYDDYKNKIRNIFESSGSKISPSISFSNVDSEFVNGLGFYENFSSADVLSGLLNSIKESKIVKNSYNSDDYLFSLDNNYLKINGETYNSDKKGSFDISNDSVSSISCEVRTLMVDNDTYKREIEFSVPVEEVTKLKSSGIDVESYFTDLAGEKYEISSKKGEYSNQYTLSFTSTDLEEILAFTNEIMKNENNEISCEATPSETPGHLDVTYSEIIDPSYYCGPKGSVSSQVSLYGSHRIIKNDDSSDNNEKYTKYGLNAGEKATLHFDCLPKYEKVKLEVFPKSSEEISCNIKCTLNGDKSEVINDLVKSSLSISKDYDGKYSKNGSEYVVSFSGKAKEISKNINDFINAHSTNEYNSSSDCFEVSSPQSTKANHAFCSAEMLKGKYNFVPVFGEQRVYLEEHQDLFSNLYYMDDGPFGGSDVFNENDGDILEEGSGHKLINSTSKGDFCAVYESVSIVWLILFIVLILIVIVAIIFIVLKLIKKKKENNESKSLENSNDMENEIIPDEQTDNENIPEIIPDEQTDNENNLEVIPPENTYIEKKEDAIRDNSSADEEEIL